ncbi:MAG: hypothetical protein OJF49_001621 [Ktedonobacterales bacterium]|jgi:hypothetical protein|nr:MAG: hypothetical protein OJF49_001621 [Ktedonobacterales bacterium]
MNATHDTKRYTRILGITASLFALLQTLIVGSAARANQADVLALQQSLASNTIGGGVNFEPFLVASLRIFLIAYVSAFIALLIIVCIAGYAGYIAALLTGNRSAGSAAGRGVINITAIIWLLATLLGCVVFHADAYISWAIATIAVMISTPQNHAPSGIYVTQPGSVFIITQIVVLLLQALVGYGLAIGFGSLAGNIGANRVRPATTYAAPV